MKSLNNSPQQDNSDVINESPESFIDLTLSEPAPTKTWVSNPFDQAYQIEQCVYDNAPPEVKELIGELEEVHTDYYTVDQLEQITQSIKHNQLAYVRDAIYLFPIKSKKLYKAKHRSFNEYAQTEIGMTSYRCNQIIEAGTVTLKLIAAGHTKLPRNSSQAYVLHKLDDEKLAEVWGKVLDSHAMHEITADKIKMVAYPPEVSGVLPGTKIHLLPSTHCKLVHGAINLGFSLSDYIEYLLELQKCKFYWMLNLVKFQT